MAKLKNLKRATDTLGVPAAARYYLAKAMGARQVRVSIEGHDVCIRPHSPDLAVAATSLSGEFSDIAGYLPDTFDGVIVDAGAYIGTAALAIARLFPKATIVSIEASAKNFKMLSLNTSHNPRIFPIHAALSSTNGETVNLQDRQTGPWGFTIIDNPADNSEAATVEAIQTITLDAILEKFPDKQVGLLKMDIEGGEMELLTSAPDQLRKFPVIFAELHERIVPGCEDAFTAFSAGRDLHRSGGEKFISAARQDA